MSKSDKVTMRLYRATEAYAKFYGGTVLVAGGVEIQQYPSEPKFNYRLAVRCTGKPPKFTAEKETP